VTACLWGNYYYNDIGRVLACGNPYANDCYCATNSVSASKVSSWMTACGSSVCAAGDYSDDMTSMHSLYASYCMNAGFTQPGATAWYTMAVNALPTPASTSATPGQTTSSGPTQTTSSGPTQTTTQLSVVTQTALPSSALLGTQVTPPQGKWLSLLLLAWLLATGVPRALY
jgi:hypothetical protein